MLVVGCGDSGGNTIAVVGDHTIAEKDFAQYLGRLAGGRFATAEQEYEYLNTWLDSLIVTRLLVQAAYERNIDQLEEVARVVLANKDKFLVDVLYSRHIADRSELTDAELREYYDHLEFKLRAYQILVADPDTAQMLFERLTEGANIEQLAYEYSIDPSARRNRGDLGYFVWGAMVDEFQEAAFNMEPGEISPPVKSRFGCILSSLLTKRRTICASHSKRKRNPSR